MGVLQRFQRRVEQLVNGAFARAFKAEVEPVEIASALQRECDDRAAIVSRGRTMVPNSFVVELGTADYQRLTVYSEPLGAELADLVAEHAAEQRYSFVGPVTVAFEEADDLDTGMFRVRSKAVAAPNQAAAGPTAPPAPDRQVLGRRGGAPAPYLEVNGTRVPLITTRTVIGRAPGADLRIDDPGISRQHAEVRITDGRATIVDLGSTNGVVVDGRRAPSFELHDGVRMQLGSTTVVYRSGAA